MATVINPLRYARRIEGAGMPRDQAEAVAEGLAEEPEGQLDGRLGRIETRLDALENDLSDLRTSVVELRGEMRTGFAELRGEIDRSHKQLLMWLIPLLSGQLLAALAMASAIVLRP